MTSPRICRCRFCGRNDLTPQGHTNHERFCDENPHRGISYDQQEDLDLEGETTDPDADPTDADPRAASIPDDAASGNLPPLTTLPSGSSVPVEGETTDAEPDADPDRCPVCESGETMDADDAKREYINAADQPIPRAVFAYELAEWTCTDPDCAAVWGDEYPEPIPMAEVMRVE